MENDARNIEGSSIELICKNEKIKTPHLVGKMVISEEDKKYMSDEEYENYKRLRFYTCLSCKSTFTRVPDKLNEKQTD